MCGIVGVVNPRGTVDVSALRAMADALEHRGPDAGGVFVSEPSGNGGRAVAGLGHRRLAILDLSEAGAQPMASDDGRWTLVFNGEIYNYPELRRELEALGERFRSTSDTEVILRGYGHWGRAVVDRIEGMFALAVWDSRDGSLLLARDRFGKKPLFHTRLDDGQFAFCSEPKALFRHPGFSARLDRVSLLHYLHFEYVPSPRSIYEGVEKLPPGHTLVWKDGKTDIRRYWGIRFGGAAAPAGPREVEATAWELLREAVRKRLASDVPLGVFLSGGIDSSTVLALMAELVPPEQISTFSIGFEEASFDESSYARQMAESVGCRHHERLFKPRDLLGLLPRVWGMMDEPMADPSIVPTMLLCGFAREHVTVALGGDGCDELMAGYDPFLAHEPGRMASRLPGGLISLGEAAARLLPVSERNMSLGFKARRFLAGLREKDDTRRHQVWLSPYGSAGVETLLAPELRAMAGQIDPLAAIGRDLDGETGDHRDALDRALHFYQRFYMSGCILNKVDSASMAVSLEVRTPMLDLAFSEFVNALPREWKMRGLTRKVLLKKLMRDRLPATILKRKKKGFGIPLARWIRTELRAEAERLFERDRLAAGGVFDPGAAQALLREHLDGTRDHGKMIWAMLCFEQWREHYLKDC